MHTDLLHTQAKADAGVPVCLDAVSSTRSERPVEIDFSGKSAFFFGSPFFKMLFFFTVLHFSNRIAKKNTYE